MDQLLIRALFLLFIVLPGIIVALVIHRSFWKRNRLKKPYRWGFYWGVQSIALAVLLIILSFTIAEDAGSVILLLALASLYGVIGYFTIKRRTWAFVTLTVFTLNPVTWIANGIYIKNRLDEFRQEKKERAAVRINGAGGSTEMERKKGRFLASVNLIKERMSKIQMMIVSIVGNAVLLVLAYAIINAIGKAAEDRYAYGNPISSFDQVWFGWIIYLLAAGIANYLWFSERQKK